MTFRPTVVKLEQGGELRWLGPLGVRGMFDGEHGFRVVPGERGVAALSSSRRSRACWPAHPVAYPRHDPPTASGP